MSDNPDIDELAERYLDLWQDQLRALAGDPEFAEVMTRLMASSAGTMPGAAAWAAWPAALAGLVPGGAGKQAGDDEDEEEAGGRPGSGAGTRPPGATAAAAPPGNRGADLVELSRRLAALEDRVAALESGLGRSRGRAQGGPRKGRT